MVPQPGDSPVPLLVRHRRTGGTHIADRRVAGVHRAAGLAGPTRRYTVIVVMLATMSSLPIIAGITAGSASVGDSVDASGTTPFIPPPSSGPVVVPPPPPSALPAEELPAGVAQQLRAVAPKREATERPRTRKPKRPSRPTESAPAPAPPPRASTEPVRPSVSPTPSPSATPSQHPTITPRPQLPTPPVVPLPPSLTPSLVPPTGLPTCWPDLDDCLSTLGANVR